MNNNLYKMLSKDNFSKLNVKINREYYYYSSTGERFTLEEVIFKNENKNNLFQLMDDASQWDPKTKGVYVNINLNLENLDSLFGPSNYVFDDAKIGVGIVWVAEKSRYKHCVKLLDLTRFNKNLTVNKSFYIENISSNVMFSLIFYISNPGTYGGNKFFANEKGMVIYEEEMWTLIVSGEGSIFPIYDIEAPKDVLRTYEVDVDDITENPFDGDHISIKLNKSHANYKYLNYNDELFNEGYFKEVLSSAMSFIILELRKNEADDKFNFTKSYEKDSILSVLKYFNDKLNIDVNGNYSKILVDFKRFFDKGDL